MSWIAIWLYFFQSLTYLGIAQFDSALPLGGRGRGFKSLYPDHRAFVFRYLKR